MESAGSPVTQTDARTLSAPACVMPTSAVTEATAPSTFPATSPSAATFNCLFAIVALSAFSAQIYTLSVAAIVKIPGSYLRVIVLVAPA